MASLWKQFCCWINSYFAEYQLPFLVFNSKGEVTRIGQYLKGKRVGNWQWFDTETHAVIKEISYDIKGRFQYKWEN